MSVYLNLETGAGGTPEDAIYKASHVANVLNVPVKLDVNGVLVVVGAHESPIAIHENYQKAVKRGDKFASAFTV
jgi:hypothetical protein